MKTCSRCKVEKPLEVFYKDRSRSDGLGVYCRDCISKRDRKRRDADPEQSRAANRRGYINRRDAAKSGMIAPGARAQQLQHQRRLRDQQLAERGLKLCARCDLEKPLDAFGKVQSLWDGLDKYCRECSKVIQHKWREESPEAQRAIGQRYHATHRKEKLARWNRWGRANPDKIKIKNKKHGGKSRRKRLAIDGFYRVLCCFRPLFWRALKSKKGGRKMFEMLGYTKSELKQHLETQFQAGMSWENYGEWVVDHIRPIASFNLEEPGFYKECWALSNLRPLWKAENDSKSSIWNGIRWWKGKAAGYAMDNADPEKNQRIEPRQHSRESPGRGCAGPKLSIEGPV